MNYYIVINCHKFMLNKNILESYVLITPICRLP
jgi:hypothetical protein